MSDIHDRITHDEGWLTRLGKRMPGYGGYLEREQRRDADQMLRKHVAQQLDRSRNALTDLKKQLTKNANWDLLGRIDTVERHLRTLADRLRYANYGESGLFDAVKIREEALDRVYQYDAQLAESAEGVEAKLREVAAAAPNALPAALDATESDMDALAAAIDDRETALRGLVL